MKLPLLITIVYLTINQMSVCHLKLVVMLTNPQNNLPVLFLSILFPLHVILVFFSMLFPVTLLTPLSLATERNHFPKEKKNNNINIVLLEVLGR